MEYKMYLTDSAGTHELPPLERQLTRTNYEKATTVEPLSGNVYRDQIATKVIYSQTWAWLTKEQYDLMDAIYERMKSEWTYPRLTVDGENINNMVVDFSLGAKRIDDDCGTVVEVEVSFRETRQMGS